MDKISFKKKITRSDPKEAGFDYTFILAEIIINDRPFLDFVWQYETKNERYYDYNIAKELYLQLISAPEGQKESCFGGEWPGKNKAVLLICGVCFFDEDDPLVVTFEETENEVSWTNFDNPRREYDYSLYPVFHFEKDQYKAALAQLKEIADEKCKEG